MENDLKLVFFKAKEFMPLSSLLDHCYYLDLFQMIFPRVQVHVHIFDNINFFHFNLLKK